MKKEWYNLKFFIKRVLKASPGYAAASFVQSVLEAILPFVAILLPKYMIDEMMGLKRIPLLGLYVTLAVLTAFIITIVSSALKRYMNSAVRDIMMKFEYEIGAHNMGVAYENLEDVKYIELKDQAMLPIRERLTLFFMVRYLPEIVRYIFTAAVAVGIMLSFDFISLFVILIPTLLIAWINQKYQKKDMEIQKKTVQVERPFMYYFNLMSDFGPGKDIRLYEFQDLLMKRNNECDEMILKFKKESGSLRYGFEAASKLLEGFRSAFIYGYIGLKALLLNIGIGDFTLYIGTSVSFSGAIAKLLEDIITLRQDCRYLMEYVRLQEIPVEADQGGITELDTGSVDIEFNHVSFCYPGSGRFVLNDVSFKIKDAESISLVGSNGAGKTTIIKLLCRLFKPTEGRILLNGIDIQTIDVNVYRKIMSVVFQDFKIFQFSIAENIAAGGEIDKERLEYSLATAGIMEKVKSLKAGADTCVGKQFDNNGTEFSGGELQKLSIARTLYKNAPLVILDEPTAALDPFSEAEVYEKFHQLSGGRTTVYISHRLSSCKFCDRILFLEDGRIIEDGNHTELMSRKGKYAQMFTLQASQYVS